MASMLQSKDKEWENGLKNKTQPYDFSKRFISLRKINTGLESKARK
jgi:hypothetical protein